MSTFSNFRLLWQGDWEGKESHSSGLHHGGSLLNGGGNGSRGSNQSGGSWEQSSEGSDHGGVVDDVLGHVLGGVLLDLDLGHVLDLVVDLVADMLDHRGGVDQGGGGGGDGVVDWLHLHGLHSSVGHGRGGSVVDSGGGGVGHGGGSGVVDDGGGHMLDHGDGLADGINEPVLVEVLGESLQSEGSVALGSGHEISDSGGQRTSRHSRVDVGPGEANTGEGEEGNLRRNI